jgi:hypothetical protein
MQQSPPTIVQQQTYTTSGSNNMPKPGARLSCIIDPTEDALGISTYLSNSEWNGGFSAISKGRFSDFVVHEGTKQQKETDP